jgi:hypothetical protein
MLVKPLVMSRFFSPVENSLWPIFKKTAAGIYHHRD